MFRRADSRFDPLLQTPIGQAHPRSTHCLLINLEKQTWPITGATFVLIYKQQPKGLTATQMLKFFDWSYRTGAELADEMQYVPMPKDVVQLIELAWDAVKDAHGQPAWASAPPAEH